jgi:hypothetical protein
MEYLNIHLTKMHFYNIVQITYFSFLFILHTFLLIISPCSCFICLYIIWCHLIQFWVLQELISEHVLKDWIQNHLSDIRTCKKYDKPVSIHLNSKGHSIDDFRFAGIEISRKNNTIYRQTCKSLFIKMCNTQQEGINKRK